MKIFKILALLITITTILTSCSTDDMGDDTSTSNKTSTAQTSTNTPENTAVYANDIMMTEEVFAVVNQYRLSIGLNVLEYDMIAEDYALGHIGYMIEKGKISHDNFFSRSDALKKTGATKVSENVAYGYKTATEALEGWLKSPSHKAAIEGDYTHTGIAISQNDKEINYFVQIFAKR